MVFGCVSDGSRMMLIFSVFAVFGVKASLERGSRAEAVEHAVCCLRGREVSTIAVYDAEYKRLVASLEARLVEADEAKAELVARLGVSEEAKAELVARLGVSEESKSSSIMKGHHEGGRRRIHRRRQLQRLHRLRVQAGGLRVAVEAGARVVGFIFDGCVFESPSFESSVSRGRLKKSTTVSSHCHCLSLREYEEEDMKTIVWALCHSYKFNSKPGSSMV